MKLHEIAGIIGKKLPTEIAESFGEKYPFIQPSNIPSYHERRIKNIEKYLSDKGHNHPCTKKQMK